jgi:hypothetical protein
MLCSTRISDVDLT